MIDSNVFKQTPVYRIHRKGYAFQKMIESTVNPSDLRSLSSRRSKVSRSSTSSENSLNFLNSPIPKSQFKTYDLQSSYKYPEPEQNYFKEYRKFLKKPVPVIRRRQLEMAIPETHPDLNQETPKNSKKTFENKQFSTKNSRKKFTIPDIPLYLYENFRFQEICKEISERRAIDQRYRLEKLKKTRSLTKIGVFHEFKAEKFPVIKKSFDQNVFFKAGLHSKVFSQKSSTKFLPARKRYLKSDCYNTKAQ
jgi:hypothetical protein